LLPVAVGLSVAVHVVAALLVVLLPRVLPRDAAPREPGTIELLMVEQKGAAPSEAGAPPESKPAPAQAVEAPKPPSETAEQPAMAVMPAPPPQEDANEAVPPVEPAPPQHAETEPEETSKQQAAKTQPIEPSKTQDARAEPPAATGPVFDLAGTESESNAYVLGGQVLPARPDDRFRNRPPIFPHDAELRGEHGTVVVVIHVSEAGVATGADVMESSGVTSLDRAALDAVRKWHFRPAMQEGRTVPFDMPFRFIFQSY
jgi:protein TonB